MEVVATDLQSYLRALWSDTRLAISSVRDFGDGHSGFTYTVELTSQRRNGRFVLRLSPPHARIAGAADVGRQGHIMEALGRSGIPVPEVLAVESDRVVDGRAFVLMELVPGVDFTQAMRVSGPEAITRSALELLKRLHNLNPFETGIGDEAPIALEEELARWARLMERAPAGLRDLSMRLRDELALSIPAAAPPRLVHGDYHYGNLLFSGSRVCAVVDWEIASIGDPLIDFGSVAVASLRRRFSAEPNPMGGPDVPIAQLADWYGLNRLQAPWYVSFSCYKYASILGYNLALHRSGRRYDSIYDQLTGTMTGLVEDGLAILVHGVDAR